MKYIVKEYKENYITLEDFEEIVDERGASETRNKTLLKRDNTIFRIVLDNKNYSYRLLSLEDFSLLSCVSFSCNFKECIKELLTNVYEIIYED